MGDTLVQRGLLSSTQLDEWEVALQEKLRNGGLIGEINLEHEEYERLVADFRQYRYQVGLKYLDYKLGRN